MTEADVLALTYDHTCTVKRPVEQIADGWDDFKLTAVYEALPCAVSFSGLPTGGHTDTVQHIDYVATLFVRPEVDLQAGDRIVADVYGQSYVFLANEPARYVSHQEVPLIRSDVA